MTNLDRAPAKIVCHRRTRKNKDEKPFVPPVHWAKKPQPVDCPVVLLVILAGMALRVAVAEIASWGNIKTTKGEQNVSNATLENCTSIPKQLAMLVALVDLAAAKVFVQHAHWVMPEKETKMVRLNVNNVNWVTQQRLKVPLNVKLAMLEHLAKPKVFVRNARMVFIKTTKGERNVSNATLENCTSVPKQRAVLVASVDLAAAKVFVQHARLVFIKTTKVKTNVSNAK